MNIRDKKNNKTVFDIVKRKLCLGCGTCYGVCPSDSIYMSYSIKNMTYIPNIDFNKCNNCSVCYKVCPGIRTELSFQDECNEVRYKIPDAGECIQCFVGHAKDKNIRFKSSSGGIATALSIYLLENKLVDAVVAVMMKENSPLDTVPILCRSRKDVMSTIGSKYCPTATNTILKEMRDLSFSSIAFIGLPCQIKGINFAKEFNPLNKIKNIYTIGLLCGGMKGQEGTRWVLKNNKISPNSVNKISYRGDGWPGRMKITFLDGSQDVDLPYPNYTDQYFDSWQPRRCCYCLDRTAEAADISLGDAWLAKYKDDSQGTSIVVTRTKKGLDLIESCSMESLIELNKLDVEDFIKSQQGLWKGISLEVKPMLYIANVMRMSLPEIRVQLEVPNAKILLRLLLNVIRSIIFRKMTLSNTCYKLIMMCISLKKRVMSSLC